MKVAAGTLAAGVIGTLVGLTYGPFQAEDLSNFGSIWFGLLTGGPTGLFLGWFMGMHGGGASASSQASESASLWGVVTGLVYGAGLGPAFGATFGFLSALTTDPEAAESLVVAGALLGLVIGPIAAVAAWEVSFFLGSFLGSEDVPGDNAH